MKRAPLRVALVAALASGCATIAIHPRKSFSLQSIPDGSSYQLFDSRLGDVPIQQGTTPAPIRLHRGAGYFRPAHYKIVVSHEGYTTETVELTPSITGWYWANVVFFFPGAVVGYLIVDPLDGAMWELDEPRAVVLKKLPGPP